MSIENLKLIYEKQNDIQNIKLYEDENKKIMLVLDTYVQFVEGDDEEIYHRMLTEPAFKMNSQAMNFLLLGAGDGLVARNIFKLNSDANITLVEIDEDVIELSKTNKRLLDINKNSLWKCNVILNDALNWIPENQNKKFDIIICDFPDPNSWELEKLYTKTFLSQVIRLLKKSGIISMQCHNNIIDKMAKIFKELLNNSRVINFTMPYLGEGNIVIGKNHANI